MTDNEAIQSGVSDPYISVPAPAKLEALLKKSKDADRRLEARLRRLEQGNFCPREKELLLHVLAHSIEEQRSWLRQLTAARRAVRDYQTDIFKERPAAGQLLQQLDDIERSIAEHEEHYENSLNDAQTWQAKEARLSLLVLIAEQHKQAYVARQQLAAIPLVTGRKQLMRDKAATGRLRTHFEMINTPIHKMADICQTERSKASQRLAPGKVTHCLPTGGFWSRCKRRQLAADYQEADYYEDLPVTYFEESRKEHGLVHHLDVQVLKPVTLLHGDNPSGVTWQGGNHTLSSKSRRESTNDCDVQNDVPMTPLPISRPTRRSSSLHPDFNGLVVKDTYDLYQAALAELSGQDGGEAATSCTPEGGLRLPPAVDELAEAIATRAMTSAPQSAAEAAPEASATSPTVVGTAPAAPATGSKKRGAALATEIKVVLADGEVKPPRVFSEMLNFSTLGAFEAAVQRREAALFDFVGCYNQAIKQATEHPDEPLHLVVEVMHQGFGYAVWSGSRYVIWTCVSVTFVAERVGPNELEVTGPIFEGDFGPEHPTLTAVLDLISFEATLLPHKRYAGWKHPADIERPGGNGQDPSSNNGSRDNDASGGGSGPSNKGRQPNSWQLKRLASSDQQHMDVPQLQLAWVPLPRLQLGRQLSMGEFADVYHGVYNGQPAVIKLLNAQGWQPHNSFMWEAYVYKLCTECQASGVLPTLLGEGMTFAGQVYFMAFSEVVGEPVSALSMPERAGVMGAAMQALQALHDKGVLHGDLHGENIFVNLAAGRPPQVTILDLGHAVLSRNKSAHERELRQLRQLLSSS